MKATSSTKCFQFLFFVLITLMAFGLITCGGGGGGSGETTSTSGTTSTPTSTPTTSAGKINNAIAQIGSDDTPNRMALISGDPGVQFFQVETAFPEAVTLIGEGTAATPFILPKFAGTPSFTQDPQLVIYAKVLAAIKDPSAVKALTDFLDLNLTGDLLWSIDAATHALKVLTGQTDVHNVLPFYTPAEVIDAINRARAWLQANPNIPYQERARSSQDTTVLQNSGCVQIILADAAGEPFTAPDPNNPGGPTQPVLFTLRMYKDLGLWGITDYQENTSDLKVKAGGGTLVSGPGSEGDRIKTARFAICGGYALREALKQSGVNKNVPWFGWNPGPIEVFKKLAGAGLLVGPKERAKAKEGDFVFWTLSPVTPGEDMEAWMKKQMEHAAIVEKVTPPLLGVGDPTITVRNKAERSSVFTADIDAKYYNFLKGSAFGTPYIFEFSNGEIPTMLVDTSLSGQYKRTDDDPYLQNVHVVVAGTIPNGTRSLLITATGDGILSNKPFRKGYDLSASEARELILPLGSKTIRVEATPDTIAYAEQYGASKILAAASTTIDLTDDNFFNPREVTLNLTLCNQGNVKDRLMDKDWLMEMDVCSPPPQGYVVVDGFRYSILSETCVLRNYDKVYVFNGSVSSPNLATNEQGEVMISAYQKTPGQGTYKMWQAWWDPFGTGKMWDHYWDTDPPGTVNITFSAGKPTAVDFSFIGKRNFEPDKTVSGHIECQ